MDYLTVLIHSFGEPQFIFVILLSLLLPLSIFVGRRNVRVHRLRILDNLARVLNNIPGEGKAASQPALEFVRARYADPEPKPTSDQVLTWLKEIGIYFLPTTIFVLLGACGFALVVGLGTDWKAAA
jgi:hypothetical protein